MTFYQLFSPSLLGISRRIFLSSGEKCRDAVAEDTKICSNFVFPWRIRDRREERRKTRLATAGAIIAIGEIVGQLSRWQFYSPCMADCAKASRPAIRVSGASWETLRGGKGKKSSNTFSLLSEHDIVRIHGEKWAPWIAAIRARIKVEKPREILATRPRTKNRRARARANARARSDKLPRGREKEGRAKGGEGRKRREKDLCRRLMLSSWSFW